MADAARTDDVTAGTPQVARPTGPPLRAEATARPEPPGDEPDVGRNATVGAVVGFLVVALVVAAGGAIGGLAPAAALGLGAFVGFWGGAGFGAMVGGTVPLARFLEIRTHLGRGDGR